MVTSTPGPDDAVRGIIPKPAPSEAELLARAKFHLMATTQHWATFREAMDKLATEEHGERERWQRDRAQRSAAEVASERAKGGS